MLYSHPQFQKQVQPVGYDVLYREGYDVLYRELNGLHMVPSAIAREALAWFTA